MRLPRRFVLVVLALALAAVGSAQPTAPPAAARAAERLDSTWRSHGAPAFSEAVALEGRIVFSAGRGLADLESQVPADGITVYDIGSVSKVHTAVAVMQLVEQGKVSLEDPVQKYVPSFPNKGPAITVRHLMTHTSGIRHYRDGDFPGTPDNENLKPYTSFEAAITIFKDDPLLFPPGQYFSYSSYAVNLLQGVVEKAGGLPFEEYMRRFVWSPAGMLSTQFDIPERVIPRRARSYVTREGPVRNVPYGDLTYKFASGGMMSTAEDLVRFGTALNAGRLLKAETLAAMYAPQTDDLREFREGKPSDRKAEGQGLLWRVGRDPAGRRFVYHCGSVQGFQACLVNYPEKDLVVAILAHSSDSTGWKENLAVADLFLETAPAR